MGTTITLSQTEWAGPRRLTASDISERLRKAGLEIPDAPELDAAWEDQRQPAWARMLHVIERLQAALPKSSVTVTLEEPLPDATRQASIAFDV